MFLGIYSNKNVEDMIFTVGAQETQGEASRTWERMDNMKVNSNSVQNV